MEKTTDGEYLGKKFERIYRLSVESEESPIPKRDLLEFPRIQPDVPLPDPAIDFVLSGEIPWRDQRLAQAGTLHMGGTRAQMALAFVTQQPFVTSNIIGATSLEQLDSNIASAENEISR